MHYNYNMNDSDKRERWTILEVDEVAIKMARKFAKKNGYTLGKAISELIYKTIKKPKVANNQLALELGDQDV